MKLTSLEELLNLNIEGDFEIYSIDLGVIQSYATLFKTDVDTSNTNVWTTIHRNKMAVTLNSINKTWK